MQHRADDLTSPGGVGATVPVAFEKHRRGIIGLDDTSEIGKERSVRGTAKGEVRSAESPADAPFATAFGEVEVLFPATLEADLPAFGIREANAVQILESHPPHPPGGSQDRTAVCSMRT